MLNAPVDWEPVMGFDPDQLPVPVQAVAFAADHVSVALAPFATVFGLAARVTVGAGLLTVTVADCDAVPPVPVQVTPKVVFALSAPLVFDPLVARLPVQPPVAVQAVALADDQVRVVLAPFFTVLGLAVTITVGAGEVTVTVVDCLALPPVPVQVNVYVVFALSAPVDDEPLRGLDPVHPPLAVQAVALVDDQARVDAAPLFTVAGLAARLTAGTAAPTETVVDCVALPPVPVQVRVYVVLALRAGVVAEPLIALVPDQPPEAAQLVALLDDQVTFEVCPLLMVVGDAEMLTVGNGSLTETVVDCVALPPVPVQVNV